MTIYIISQVTVVVIAASVTHGRPSKNPSDVTETPVASPVVGGLVSKFLGRGDKGGSSPSPDKPDKSQGEVIQFLIQDSMVGFDQ